MCYKHHVYTVKKGIILYKYILCVQCPSYAQHNHRQSLNNNHSGKSEQTRNEKLQVSGQKQEIYIPSSG